MFSDRFVDLFRWECNCPVESNTNAVHDKVLWRQISL